jgi:hypothetical protein
LRYEVRNQRHLNAKIRNKKNIIYMWYVYYKNVSTMDIICASYAYVYMYVAPSIYKYHSLAKHWWLMPVILTTWESEIGRTAVQGQTRQIVHETLISKNNQRKMDWR